MNTNKVKKMGEYYTTSTTTEQENVMDVSEREKIRRKAVERRVRKK